MVRKNITAYLDCVTNMIRQNYPTETIEDLEFIAREEFNVRHINHKFKEGMNTSSVYRNEKMELVINYLAFSDIGERLVLGHEIGHIAAGHLGMSINGQVYLSNTPKKEWENEANYFSARLNGRSDAADYRLLREAERRHLREIYDQAKKEFYLAMKEFKIISRWP